MEINYDTSRPIYKQIMEYIIRKLANGKLKPGEKLPSQRELAEELKVNPNTIQRAYREMEIQDIVETRRGVGTFVTDSRSKIQKVSKELSRKIITDFIKQMYSMGFNDDQIIKMVRKELEQGGFKNE
ncbi:MAG: GntR family transcriptional regulator [Bacillota bacterium]